MRSYFPFFILALIFLSLNLKAQNLPPALPTAVQIIRVDAMGNGCKPGSVATAISPDNKDLSLIFDNFIAESGGQIAQVVDKKICVINIDFAIPDGYSMGLVSADYRGFVALEAGTIGQHEVLYSFNKSYAGSSFSSRSFQGPMTDNYDLHNDINANLINWSMCNARQVTLTLRVGIITQVQRPGGGSQRPAAMMTLDSIDSSSRQNFNQNFSVGWKACSSSGKPGRPDQPGDRPGDRPGKPGRPGDVPTFPGDSGNGQKNYLEVFQMWNGQTRYLTSDPRLVERGAWMNQGTAFGLLKSGFGLVNLVQCLIPSQGKYFVSTDVRCEGQQIEKIIGNISSVAQAGLVPLYRYYNPSNSNDRIVTTNASEAAGYIQERMLGFVVRTRP